MAAEQFQLAARLQVHTSLHIAGPGRTLPLVDRSVEVDELGLPLIPASSFRGRLRAHVERLLKTLGEQVCQAPRPDRMCPHAGLPNFCRACCIFGSAWRLSAVSFSDWTLSSNLHEAFRDKPLPLRTNISINRRLNTAEEQRLFVMETVPSQLSERALCFEGRIEGWLEQDELGWLLAGLRTLSHIGSSKARGLGRVSIIGMQLLLHDKVQHQWQSRDWGAVLREVVSRGAT
jgi:CRISPR/Cas system CSM-associated protein Csm3 (group 7 of RAMP superfamily)